MGIRSFIADFVTGGDYSRRGDAANSARAALELYADGLEDATQAAEYTAAQAVRHKTALYRIAALPDDNWSDVARAAKDIAQESIS